MPTRHVQPTMTASDQEKEASSPSPLPNRAFTYTPPDRKLQHRTKSVGWATHGWFTPDATVLATAGRYKMLELHDLRTGEATVAAKVPTIISTTAVSPLGDLCCTGEVSGCVTVFALESSPPAVTKRWEYSHAKKVADAIHISTPCSLDLVQTLR